MDLYESNRGLAKNEGQIIIIVTSFAPISSKIKLSGAKYPGISSVCVQVILPIPTSNLCELAFSS